MKKKKGRQHLVQGPEAQELQITASVVISLMFLVQYKRSICV